jgi:hypothetical protein
MLAIFLAPGEFVDELVEVADLPHQRVRDLFHAQAAHDARDEPDVRVHPGRAGEEHLEVDLVLDRLPKLLTAVAREPCDDLVDLFLRPPLPRGLLHVERVDAPERCLEDPRLLVHARPNPRYGAHSISVGWASRTNW